MKVEIKFFDKFSSPPLCRQFCLYQLDNKKYFELDANEVQRGIKQLWKVELLETKKYL